MRRELRELKGDAQAYGLYLEAIAKLRASGVLNALRALGRPTRYNTGKDPNQMASEAAWSAGFNDCLDALQHFKELYLDEPVSAYVEAPDFGAIDLAVARGDLTKEEADARKRGTDYGKPELSTVTGNLKKPSRPEVSNS